MPVASSAFTILLAFVGPTESATLTVFKLQSKQLVLQTMIDRLRATTFRSPLRLMVSMLEQDAECEKRQEG
jgi:hypothetical protein